MLAPTNSAFEAMPKDDLRDLLKSAGKLMNVLLGHVVVLEKVSIAVGETKVGGQYIDRRCQDTITIKKVTNRSVCQIVGSRD